MGSSDGGQERYVLVSVGVAVSLSEVESVTFGELLHRGELPVAPQCATTQPAGQQAALALEFGAQDVIDAELACHRRDLEAGCGRGDDDGVALPLVGLHRAPRTMEQRARD